MSAWSRIVGLRYRNEVPRRELTSRVTLSGGDDLPSRQELLRRLTEALELLDQMNPSKTRVQTNDMGHVRVIERRQGWVKVGFQGEMRCPDCGGVVADNKKSRSMHEWWHHELNEVVVLVFQYLTNVVQIEEGRTG